MNESRKPPPPVPYATPAPPQDNLLRQVGVALGLICAFGVALVMVARLLNSRTPPPPPAVTIAAPRPAPARRPEPQIAVDAGPLVQAYAANEIAADRAYKGKTLVVTGFVRRVARTLGSSYVSLSGPTDEIRSVQCSFPDEANDQLAQLTPGQYVAIKGRCDGLMINVGLKECALVDVHNNAR